jgi:hypothetical protein
MVQRVAELPYRTSGCPDKVCLESLSHSGDDIRKWRIRVLEKQLAASVVRNADRELRLTLVSILLRILPWPIRRLALAREQVALRGNAVD